MSAPINHSLGEPWQSLPFQYKNLRAINGSRPVGFRFSPFIVELSAEFEGIRMDVCGEATTADLAATRAVAELLERTALMIHSNQLPDCTLMTSNGWAAHPDAHSAKTNAILELVERDAVLAQWYNQTAFTEILQESLPSNLLIWIQDELSQSEFPFLRVLLSTEGLGPSVTCLLMNRSGFGVASHATKIDLFDSIEAAICEACRSAHLCLRRSFWNDSLKLKILESTFHIAPAAHSLYYAYHEPLPQWMFGNQILLLEAQKDWQNRFQQFNENHLKHFKFETLIESPICIGLATHPMCFELSWGNTIPEANHKIAAIRRHCTSISKPMNYKPHIIS